MPQSNNITVSNILKMELTNVKGQAINLRFVFVECSVYQDIWTNNVTCTLLITDALNLPQNFGIFGFETLLLEFETPHKTKFSKLFRLFKLGNKELLKDGQAAYMLHFVSVEAVTNLTSKLSKSYKGQLVSDIVTDLHTNQLKSSTQIVVEPTMYQQHFIVPNLYPVQAINTLATRANSATYKGANYLYFEDAAKYNFVSLESLFTKPSKRTYLYQIANVFVKDANTTTQADPTSVYSYKFSTQANVMENLQRGMYGNELITHSHINKQWKRYTFDYEESFDDYEHLEDNQLYPSQNGTLSGGSGKLKLHSTGNDDYPFLPEKWILPRQSQLQQINNIKLEILIPGDSSTIIGEVVTFNLPSHEAIKDNTQDADAQYSGDYLVTSVRHKLTPYEFVTKMELIKDSVKEAYL